MEDFARAACENGTEGGLTPHSAAGVSILILTLIRMRLKARRGAAREGKWYGRLDGGIPDAGNAMER